MKKPIAKALLWLFLLSPFFAPMLTCVCLRGFNPFCLLVRLFLAYTAFSFVLDVFTMEVLLPQLCASAQEPRYVPERRNSVSDGGLTLYERLYNKAGYVFVTFYSLLSKENAVFCWQSQILFRKEILKQHYTKAKRTHNLSRYQVKKKLNKMPPDIRKQEGKKGEGKVG